MQATFPSHKTSCKMQKATHISSFLFNCQLSTTSECSGVAAFESSLTLPASAKASYVSTSSSTGPGGKVACGRECTSTSGFRLWSNHASLSAVMRPHIGHSSVVRGKNRGVHHPNSRAHTKVWESMVEKSVKRGGKWVKVGENPKMPYPQCGKSIKTYARGNNDARSITKHGSPVRLDAQIVALRPHCTRTAHKAPPQLQHASVTCPSPCDIYKTQRQTLSFSKAGRCKSL